DHGEVVGKGHGLTYGGPKQVLIPYFLKSTDRHKSLCRFIEDLRNDKGYINALSNKFVLLQLLCYNVDNDYIRSEVSNDLILHSNGNVYQGSDIQQNRLAPEGATFDY